MQTEGLWEPMHSPSRIHYKEEETQNHPLKGKKQTKKSQTVAAVGHFIVLNTKKQSLFYDFFLLCSKKLRKEATTAQIWTKQSRPHVCDTARS